MWNVQECCGGASIFFSLKKTGLFLPCLSQTFYYFKIVLLSTVCPWGKNSWWTAPSKQRNSQHHFHIWPNLPCLFGSGWCFWDPLRRLGFCFNIITEKPSVITCSDVFKKFLSLFAWSKSPWLTSRHLCIYSSADVAQIWLQQAAYPNFQSKSCGNFWNANFIGYFLHCQTSIWMDDFTTSFDMLVIFWHGGSSRTWVIFICLNHLYDHEFEFGSWIHYQTFVLTMHMPLEKFSLN